MIDVVDWDEDFEALVRLLDHMPPTLLEGLLCHATKALYQRGVFGTASAECTSSSRPDRVLINGSVSRRVQAVERDLLLERNYGAQGYEVREKTAYKCHAGRHHRQTDRLST